MGEKKMIMIVEDDVFIRDIYQVKFVQEGFDVVTAEDGVKALEMLKEITPDAILLDIMMPRMNGMEVLKNLKADEKFSKIPVIMLTNNSEKEKVDEAMNSGINGYLIKSHFTPSEVVSKVNSLLGA